MNRFALLVVAKAPVPGFAKTRLCPPATPDQAAGIAAGIAAASLLDTLDAVLATPGAIPMVAFTGDLHAAANHHELAAALDHTTVLPQRGDHFGERLANAHADTAARLPGLPVLQIGMDTPQVTPSLLAATAARLGDREAVLGPADDGGWWALGLRDPLRARALVDVPMSMPGTGALTRKALSELTMDTAPRLSDVDTMADALAVASRTRGRFAAAVGQAA